MKKQDDLSGKTIAILAADGFEESELLDPKKAIEDAGGKAVVVSMEKGEITAYGEGTSGENVAVDQLLGEVSSSEFHGLVLPGGLHNPDTLRAEPDAVSFVRSFFKEGKPVAAICHGPWLLVEVGVLEGRTLTSFPSIQTDIKNAGGIWVDEEVHCDEGLVTSRKPGDLKAFCAKALEEFAEGVHEEQTV